jgi:ribosomal-protein-alanine N-acetyltransferase
MPTMPLLHPTTTVVRTSAAATWRGGLPVLTSPTVTLREVRPDDATLLVSMLASEEVSRFISPPPSAPDEFARFIDWAMYERAAGGHVCYAVVPAGMSLAVGLFQLRALDPGFGILEWGFALGSPFWGSGLFEEAARLMADFAFGVVGARRLEARAVVANGRGNGALRKIGAVQEGVLRRSFLRHGRYHDQILWAILAEDWKLQQSETRPVVH